MENVYLGPTSLPMTGASQLQKHMQQHLSKMKQILHRLDNFVKVPAKTCGSADFIFITCHLNDAWGEHDTDDRKWNIYIYISGIFYITDLHSKYKIFKKIMVFGW